MKILFINTGPWGTGSFTCIKGLTKELLKLGHEVKIFFPDANFESIDKNEYYKNPELYKIWEFPISNNDVTIPTFPLMITDPHPRNPDPITFKNLSKEQLNLYEYELNKELSQLIQSFKPDIIECHHIWYSSWVLYKMGLDYLAVAHHSDQLGLRYDQRICDKAVASANQAQTIIAISESVKREVMRLYHVPEEKIVIISNGYDKEIFHKKQVDREKLLKELGLNIDPNAIIVNFAGKMSRTKGVDILLQANKLLNEKQNIHFILMGSGSIEGILDRLEPGSYSLRNIHVVGQQTPANVADIHNISKLSVMPSRSEGFGISGLEAMGCGLPIVVSHCGGPEHFAVGKIIDIGSPEQLATEIKNIINLPKKEYDILSQRALETAEKYTWQKSIQSHLKIYNEILSKNRIKYAT